jgi:tetratricopeptide (TPR) repeat protein
MPVRLSLGLLRYFAGRFCEAERALAETVELDPSSGPARLFRGLSLAELGSYEAAMHQLQVAIELARSPEVIAGLGFVCGLAGRTDAAREHLAQLERLSAERYVSPSLLAQIHAGLGETAPALHHLRRAFDVRAADLAWLSRRPVFRGLHDASGFDGLMQRLGQPA